MADPALERERPPTSGSSATAPPQRADEIFLEGPRSRFDELITLFRVLLDFLRGFRVLHFVGPCVTVFGSARLKEGHPSYELARKMGAAIAQLGFTVMTGGGPGIMEAANRGAKDVNGRSVGCNIAIAIRQAPATPAMIAIFLSGRVARVLSVRVCGRDNRFATSAVDCGRFAGSFARHAATVSSQTCGTNAGSMSNSFRRSVIEGANR